VAEIEEVREREVKFDVPFRWELPDPSGLAPQGSVEHDVVHLESTYYDTAERDLLRNRLTLRRRAGDTDTGWQLKLPAGDARTEIRLPADGKAMPAQLRDITLGVRGGRALRPIALLATDREVHRLLDGRSALAEIVVDTVTATRAGDAATARWREVEVELVEGDERLLAQTARWLGEHGAEQSPSGSKLARAIGVEPRTPRDVSLLSGLAGAYLDEQADAIVRGDIALRRGSDAIHATRVGTRRFRSVLRVLGGVFEGGRAAALDAELAWFASALGTVRDRHVLRAHLDDALGELAPELILGPVVARIHRTLAAEEQEAMTKLAALMRTKRYFALLAEVRAWCDELSVVADEPAAHVGSYLAKAVRKVRRRIKHVPAAAGRDEALHRARKAAKRARYIAELARPELGEEAHVLEKEMKRIQERLGLRQDRVVAAAFLRRLGAAAGAAGENGFTYGLLYERELVRAREVSG
jgi:CHAD domain-containing protein